MIVIRSSRLDDSAAMWAIRTRAVRTGCAGHYTAAEIAAWTATAPPPSYPRLLVGGGAVVAEVAGRMAGFAMLDLDSGEIEAVFVDPDHAGKGIGQRLLRALLAVAISHGLSGLHLYASLNAVAFYQGAGFVRVRDERYPHPSGVALACVLMRWQREP